MADLSLLVQQSLANIRRAQEQFDAAMTEAQVLVRQAGEQHADGNLAEARESINSAGDLLYTWLGDSDAVGPLEESIWEGAEEDGIRRRQGARS